MAGLVQSLGRAAAQPAGVEFAGAWRWVFASSLFSRLILLLGRRVIVPNTEAASSFGKYIYVELIYANVCKTLWRVWVVRRLSLAALVG